eukprot:scaffold3596_cov316-Prasinococcus_capsulatus_cf.AAC.11
MPTLERLTMTTPHRCSGPRSTGGTQTRMSVTRAPPTAARPLAGSHQVGPAYMLIERGSHTYCDRSRPRPLTAASAYARRPAVPRGAAQELHPQDAQHALLLRRLDGARNRGPPARGAANAHHVLHRWTAWMSGADCVGTRHARTRVLDGGSGWLA